MMKKGLDRKHRLSNGLECSEPPRYNMNDTRFSHCTQGMKSPSVLCDLDCFANMVDLGTADHLPTGTLGRCNVSDRRAVS